MQKINIAQGPQDASRLILGCMRMPALSIEEAAKLLCTACELGINFVDHATCYGNGEAEKRFGDAMALAGMKREDLIIQSKCGLRFDKQIFDWRKSNIINSVDEILSRLQMEYLDVLLLHRPDLLYEPEQIAEAFDALETAGKVRTFGVSNTMPMQIELLKKYVKQPLKINQLQLSVEQSQLIDQDLYMNNKTTDMSVMRDGGALDYSRLHDITIQAWSPLQVGMFGGMFIENPEYPELNRVLAELAEKYDVTKSAIAIAWILRHPAKMQVITGTMNPVHLTEMAAADRVELTHEEWYRLYLASGKFLP
ncbi:MAG: aldo/keto reductase [Lachnospiraceae bacterium]|nr:aldo/keto reductase [Lachnospiraceae bacterium]MDY5741822.1 aldo/keto reductase [Lachnospiraceae bacterium]